MLIMGIERIIRFTHTHLCIVGLLSEVCAVLTMCHTYASNRTRVALRVAALYGEALKVARRDGTALVLPGLSDQLVEYRERQATLKAAREAREREKEEDAAEAEELAAEDAERRRRRRCKSAPRRS